MTTRTAAARQFLAALLVMTLAACGGANSEANADAAESQSPSSEPRYGGNLVIGQASEPTTFNPAFMADLPSMNVAELMFAAPLRVNERFEVEPLLADGMPEVSPDGTVWTMRLRRGVKFHDGVELTADDVAFTYGVHIHPDYIGPRAGLFRTLVDVAAVDDYTVRFTLSEPDARFTGLLTDGILPKHLLEHVAVKELGDYREFNVDRPVGAGPFKFVSWTAGQNLVVEAFDEYIEGRPFLDRITVRFVGSDGANVLMLEAGEIDFTRVPMTEVSAVERIANVTLHRRTVPDYEYVGWNLRNDLFTDRRVRQALAHAVDRQEIVDTLLSGEATVAHAALPPVIGWAYTEDVPRFPYDPERAKALLREAGWIPGADGILTRDGRRFSFTLLYDDGTRFRADLAVILQQYFAEVGVELRPIQMEFGAFLARIDPPSFDFDAYMISIRLPIDPDPSLIWHSREIERGLNNIAFSNARVDELADANTRLLSRPERVAVLNEIWRILAEEQPYLFLFYPTDPVAVRSDVRGYTPHPLLVSVGANRWWLARDE